MSSMSFVQCLKTAKVLFGYKIDGSEQYRRIPDISFYSHIDFSSETLYTFGEMENAMYKILIVEDDYTIAELLRKSLLN